MHFTRSALGTQSAPPNQVLVGLSLFLTFFIMAPTFKTVYDDALKPLSANEISGEEALDIGMGPIRDFMFEHTNSKDIRMFIDIAGIDTETLKDYNDIPIRILGPSPAGVPKINNKYRYKIIIKSRSSDRCYAFRNGDAREALAAGKGRVADLG